MSNRARQRSGPTFVAHGSDPLGLRDRVGGSLHYALDVELPGMVHAALVRSPMPSGRLLRLDTAAAAALPGVVAVVTAGDLARLGLADTRFGTMVPDQPILAGDRVRHVGEPVGAVVALSAAAARDAARLVVVATAPEAAVFDPNRALEPGAPLVHEDRPGNVLGRAGFHHGDLEAAERATVHRFAAEYTSPAAQQVTLEPQVCVARWVDGRLEVWAATQSPSRVAAELARVFGLAETAVRVVAPPLGGGYGGKNHAKLEPVAAAIARLVGRPVRLANRRAEEFITTTKHPARIWIESGLDADARFTFRRARIRWSAGAYAHSSPAVLRAGALVVCGPYRVPAAEVESVMALTNLPPAGSFRGLGANQAAWAGERQVDEVARALGIDPLEFRRRNVVRPGDRLPTGERVDDAHWLECLDEVGRRLGEREGQRRGGPAARVGTGVALAMKHTMTPSRSEAIVAALPDGSLEVRSSLVDMGQGLPAVLVRAAVEALGVPPGRVRVHRPDTSVTPFDPTTSSSRGTWAGSTAVRAACADLRSRLELPAGGPFPSGPDLAALVRESGAPEVEGRGESRNEAPIDPQTGVAASSSHWHQGAVGVRASVDAETGVIRVSEAFGAAWAGRVVVPDAARLQTEGGLVYGLGPALFEELDFPGGTPAVSSLFDYRIPSLPDTPRRLETVALEADDPGAEPTGLGESITPAVAPAVAAALADATGLEARDLPLDPERVVHGLAALHGTPWPLESTERGQPRAVTPPPPESRAEPVDLSFTVDGRPVTVTADPLSSLRDVLGETLRVRSVREPCGVGVCGACTVLVDGRAVRSCLRPVGLAAGAAIVTAQGLPPGHAVLEAFVEAGAAQCGFCIPGAVLSAVDLLGRNPMPDADAIRAGLAGNLCRCGTYGRIVDAVTAAAIRLPIAPD